MRKAPHLILALASCALLAGVVTARAEIKVGFITSTTGPGAAVGTGQVKALPLLPTKVGNEKIRYIFLNDGSDPTNAVQNAKRLILDEHVDAMLGPMVAPSALAVIGLLQDAKVSSISLSGVAAVVVPAEKRHWVFKDANNNTQLAQSIVDHMAASGVKTVGAIIFNDAYGEGWIKAMQPLLTQHGIKLVDTERYARNDTSVTGQVLRLIAAHPDAVFIGAASTAGVLPEANLRERGFKGRVYQTDGILVPDFLRVGGKAVEGTIAPAGPMLVAEQLPDSHPSKAAALKFVKAYEALPHTKRSPFAANVWDAAIIFNAAFKKALAEGHKPGTVEFRQAVRDAMEGLHDLVISNGVINYSETDHVGLDKRARVLLEVKNGAWKLLQ